jgi:hypothetical protein
MPHAPPSRAGLTSNPRGSRARAGRGRPRLGCHQIEITLDDHLWSQLQAREQTLGVYRSSLVRQALREYLRADIPPVQ